MEGLAQAITTLPPDAIDRQRLMECLGNAEKNRRNGKVKEAAKWVMQVGITLNKKGGDALPLAERTFQHSVFLAKQLDNNAPDYMQLEREGNNSELGDAYAWLGATEDAMGKNVEAETHYKAAARAVEDRSVVELGDKLLHQAIFFRNRKMNDKYDAVMKRWENAIRDASSGECPEGDVALLHATVNFLQEKATGLLHGQGGSGGGETGPGAAGAIRGGPLSDAATRLEAHPLRHEAHHQRHKPHTTPSDTLELAAETYARLKDKKTAMAYLRRSLAALACSCRFMGLEPLGESIKNDEENGGDDAVAWTRDLLGSGRGNNNGGGGEGGSGSGSGKAKRDGKENENENGGNVAAAAPAREDNSKLTAREAAALETVLKVGDRWKMRGGKPGEKPPCEGADEVGNQTYILGQQLFAAEQWKECQRPLRAAAALLTHKPFQQGAACHYLACAYFHENAKHHRGNDAKLMTYAAGAFQSAAAARLSLGTKHATAVKEATGSLLFLGRVLVDMNNWRDAERVYLQALELAREALGDKADETQQCLHAMMDMRGKMRAMQEAIGSR